MKRRSLFFPNKKNIFFQKVLSQCFVNTINIKNMLSANKPHG